MTMNIKICCLILLTLFSVSVPVFSFAFSTPFARNSLAPLHLRRATQSCPPAQFSLNQPRLKSPSLIVSDNGRQSLARQPLRMSSDGSVEAEDKIREAKRLADEAAKALELANEAGAKAAALRSSSGAKVYSQDRGTEIRTKELLGSIGGVLYKSWATVLTGNPWKEGDLLGLRDEGSEEEQLEKAKEVFERFDTDGSGGIDAAELQAALHDVVGLDTDHDQVGKMLSEADENGDGVIQINEFVKIVSTFRKQIEAESMRDQDRLAAAAAAEVAALARAEAMRPVSKEEVVGALAGLELVGNASVATAALDDLSSAGTIRKWNTYKPLFRPVSTERMQQETGIEDTQGDLGLGVDLLTRIRYQGVGFLSFTGGFCLLFAGLFPQELRPMLVSYGYYTLALNTLSALLSAPIDRQLARLQRLRSDKDGARGRQRQAGRLVASYLCGLPLASAQPGAAGLVEVAPYSRRSGDVDLAALRRDVSPQGLFSSGLSDREVYQQAIVQMAGPVAEYKKFGKATFGQEFFAELGRQMALSERAIVRDPGETQTIAQFGVASAFSLLSTYEEAVDRVALGLQKGCSVPELIAEIEAADVVR